MKLLIVTYAPLIKQGDLFYSYAPYVKEMEIWIRYADETAFCCPTYYSGKDLLLAPFQGGDFRIFPIPELQIKDISKPWKLIKTIRALFRGMQWADHIHLRCPGNVGLLGCFVQIFYPQKKKTAKYAGNWDWKSKQPWSYRLQQRILRNTFLTRNMTVLVYGEWPDRTENILPFFTASYSEKNKTKVLKPEMTDCVRLAFVGILSVNKSPLTSLEVLKTLKEKGISAHLTYCGDGPEKKLISEKVTEWGLGNDVEILGNVSSERVSEVLGKSHFLVFISKSEGWPKAVAEAMWWGCIPITTAVSCVPQMLGGNRRGYLVENNPEEIAIIIQDCLKHQDRVSEMQENEMAWARQYTLERFDNEIRELTKQAKTIVQ